MLQKYTKSDFFFFFFFFNFFFNISFLLWQISPLGDWILRKLVNHTNLHDKTLYNNANFISLGKIFDAEDTLGRGGWNSMGNLATKAVI